MQYERLHRTLHALDPKDWVDLDGAGERFALRRDVLLQIQLEEAVDGEEVGECYGVLPDKYETFVLRYGAVELCDYIFAVMDRRHAGTQVVPYAFDSEGERVSLIHYNVGCLVYGKDVMDSGIQEYRLPVAVAEESTGLR